LLDPKFTCDTRLYDLLGTSRPASEADIKKAYRRLALVLHPDKGGDQQHFNEIRQAYQLLSDPEQKRLYDLPCASSLSEMQLTFMETVGVALLQPTSVFTMLSVGVRLRAVPDDQALKDELIRAFICSVRVMAGDGAMWDRTTKEWNLRNTHWGIFGSTY
jgi:hypothetical protein